MFQYTKTHILLRQSFYLLLLLFFFLQQPFKCSLFAKCHSNHVNYVFAIAGLLCFFFNHVFHFSFSLFIFHQVFQRVSANKQLKVFKDSLRLFMHHFLIKSGQKNGVPTEHLDLVQERVLLIDKHLNTSIIQF